MCRWIALTLPDAGDLWLYNEAQRASTSSGDAASAWVGVAKRARIDALLPHGVLPSLSSSPLHSSANGSRNTFQTASTYDSTASSTSDVSAAIALRMMTARRLRLGRLRMSVVRRLQPLSTRLPLLEHATAVLDAHVLTTVFGDWKVWTGRMRAVRGRCGAATLRRVFDRLAAPSCSDCAHVHT
jgi:hypothetical protein